MATSLYKPLKGNQIRIVRIEAGQVGDPIKSRLFRRRLSTHLIFQALSYEWGGRDKRAEIFCNNVSLRVTQNLVDALESLRYQEKQRYLWVDAICINQADEQEKSTQVRLMRNIYASAKSVLVWLGLSFDGVTEAFRIFPYLARIAVERHPTGKPDSLTMETLLRCQIHERPTHGSILRSKDASFYTRHDRDIVYTNIIPSCAEQSDEEIFLFGSDQVWGAIDALFNSTYFYRSWIVQEISVAEGIYVVCGQHVTNWDIFHVAYEGRSLLRFMIAEGKSNILCVRDARRRYRSRGVENFHCLDLAQVLTSFTYSRESNACDRIYAALGIVYPPNICDEIVPDYSKKLSEVFYDAARHMILFRNDLYLWSSKSFRPTRTLLDLPTWAPEWTMPACEEALEFCSSDFAGCVPGNHMIEGNDLLVDGHLLDRVCSVFRIGNFADTIKLMVDIRDWLRHRGSSLFSEYPIPCQDAGRTNRYHSRLECASAESRSLLNDYNDLPLLTNRILQEIGQMQGAHNVPENRFSNIESLWLVLTASWYHHHNSTRKCGHRLILAMLFVLSLHQSASRKDLGIEKIPEPHNWWIIIAIVLLTSTHSFRFISDILLHEMKMENDSEFIEDHFFITDKGFFGRAPASAVKPGLFVAIMGGAWTPYLLESHAGHFQLVCHTYVEGLMSISRLGPGSSVEQLKLR